MNTKRCFLCTTFSLMAPALLEAQVVPGRWEKVEELVPGSAIVIRLKSGDRLEGTFRSVEADEVRFADLSGKEIGVPKSEVRSLEKAGTPEHRLRRCVLIGAGAGSLAAVLSLIGYAKSVTASGSIWGEEMTGYLVGAGLVGAGIGALAGAGVYATLPHNEIIYRAP